MIAARRGPHGGVALHLTKVAFGVDSLESFVSRWRDREGLPPYELTTRYLPKRHAEIGGQGSLFWILKHQLVARDMREQSQFQLRVIRRDELVPLFRHERAPDGFQHVNDVISQETLEEISSRYKRLAGFDKDALRR